MTNDKELENLIESMDVEQLKGMLVAMAFKGIANEKITQRILAEIKKKSKQKRTNNDRPVGL